MLYFAKRSMRVWTTACDMVRSGPCLADDTHAFDQAEQQAGGGRGLDAIGQLSRCLRARQRPCQPCLHRLEEPPDALLHLGVVGGQFHGGRHHQASALAGNAVRAIDITSQTGPQTRQGIFPWIEFGIEPRQSIVDIAIEGAQKEPVLVAKGCIETSAREVRRLKQIRE